MNGISLITALVIQNRNDLIYTSAGPDDDGLFSGWITMPSGRPLLSTKFCFPSKKEALNHIKDVRSQIESLTLTTNGRIMDVPHEERTGNEKQEN